MAQILETWATESAALPAGWSARWNTLNSARSVPEPGRLRWAKSGSNNRAGISCDAVDGQADCDLVAMFVTDALNTSTASPIQHGLYCRGSGAVGAETLYLSLLRAGSAGQLLEVGRYVGGTFATIQRASYQWSAGERVWMRLRVQGTALMAKAWAVGQTEPAGWAVSGTDANITAGGWAGVFAFFAPQNLDVFPVGIGTAGDAAPMLSVSGVIKDAAGAPVERVVRLIHRSSGDLMSATMSDGTSGEYTLSTPYLGEHQRIVLAGNDPLYNDIIDRVIPG